MKKNTSEIEDYTNEIFDILKWLVIGGKCNLSNDVYPFIPNRNLYLSDQIIESIVDEFGNERKTSDS